MVSETPKVTASGHYTLSQAANALGIDRRTLAKHTEMRHIKCHVHRYTKRLFYEGRDIIRFWGAEY